MFTLENSDYTIPICEIKGGDYDRQIIFLKEKDDELKNKILPVREFFIEDGILQQLPNKKARVLFIAGCSGSGKSTYIKMLMCNIILAQTIGYVPAKSFILTPFTHLHSYLNIPDVNGKESLFQAEMKRCSQLIDKLKYAENEMAHSTSRE